MAERLDARAALAKLVMDFTEAFNREDLDEMMGYFAAGAVYGAFGRMQFHTEDMFLEVETGDTGKALIRWQCTLEEDTRQGAWRGLDILHFEAGRLTEKLSYAKAKAPLIRAKEEMVADGTWPAMA